MFAYLAVALATSDLRVASHMREDPSLGAAVLPSGEIELTSAADPPPPPPAAAEPAAPAPTPRPPPTPEPCGLSDAECAIRNMDGDRFLPTPRPTPPPTKPPKASDHMKAWKVNAPTLHHASRPTPTLDDADDFIGKQHEQFLYNQSHAEELDAKLRAQHPLDPQEIKNEAEEEAMKLENLTLSEAAGAVMEVMVGEPMRLLSDMESFLFELKNAVVGPPLEKQIMRDDGSPGPLAVDEMAAGTAALKAAMALTAAQGQGKHLDAAGLKTLQQVEITKPTGETEYVVSVNGIMEYRPPTAHGAVRVVSVLLLLASAIVLGIGWRYGSAPGMYPYVEDCRL